MQPENTFRSSAGVTFDLLLRYNELETAHWERWFRKQPAKVVDLPASDPAVEMGRVRDLLFHILIVEWVYARVLRGEPWESEWQKFDRSSCEDIFRVVTEGQPNLRNSKSSTRSRLAADRPLAAVAATS